MDKRISNIIKEWKDEAGVEGIILVSQFSTSTDVIKICTDKPGYMIGKGGELVNKYINKLKEVNHKLDHVEFIETDRWYIK